jgi:hypothetical protein
LRTPVALIIFNRPETTARVFAEIARARPPKLLVIADGPRAERPGEAEKCLAARAIVGRVDWNCEVLTNYSDVNLGCKVRPASGLNWVFETVEEAIILEDDCLPHQSFFRFCEELLEEYRTDERVMAIGGANLLGEWRRGSQSYYFSRLGGSWGWATWRRAWKHFDAEIKLWPKALEARVLEDLFPNPKHSGYWKLALQKVYGGEIESAWDYQWLLACWLNSGWRVVPEVNLVSNIGFGADATHHQDAGNALANLPTREMAFPLRHPQFMTRDADLDDALSEKFYSLSDNPNVLSRLGAKVARAVSRSVEKT